MYEIDENTVRMPMLALRGLVLFPNMILHFDVGREKSIAALKKAMDDDQYIYLVAQKVKRQERQKKIVENGRFLYLQRYSR